MKVFRGDIIDQVDKALNFVLEHIPMAAWVVPGRVEREEKYAYPPDGVREAIINAICHRDYESPSNVQVRVFDDRIEIWNPGRLPEGWTVETLKRKHESKPFNPLIANQFFLIRFIEKWGTGINDMIEECIEWGLPEPGFEFTGTSLVVTFRRSLLTKESLRELGLNDRQIEIIKYLRKRESITSSEYVEMFGITGRQARMDLSQLVSAGLILKIGRARQTKYRFNPEISGNIRKLRLGESGRET
jgi:ATP-dependent DNA helicase RecG